MTRKAKILTFCLTAGLAFASLGAQAMEKEDCVQKLKAAGLFTNSQLEKFCATSDPAAAAAEEYRLFGEKDYQSMKAKFAEYLKPDPSISCYDPTVMDAGYSVTLTKNGANYDYTFAQDSIAGPHVISERSVRLEGHGPEGECDLSVSTDESAPGSESGKMFRVVKAPGAKYFALRPVRASSKVPKLECRVEASVANELCSKQASAPKSDDYIRCSQIKSSDACNQSRLSCFWASNRCWENEVSEPAERSSGGGVTAR